MATDMKDLVERLRAMNLAQCEAAATALEARAQEIALLVNENDELRRHPWPGWASNVLTVIRSRSGYDGYDDAIDGVDLPAELEETIAELEHQVEMLKRAGDANLRQWGDAHQRAEAAERERDALKAENERLREALEGIAKFPNPPTVSFARARAALHPTQGGE